MRKIQVSVISGLALVLLIGFQNCGKKSFDGAPETTTAASSSDSAASVPSTVVSPPPVVASGGSSVTAPVVTTSGSTVSNSVGQMLSFNANDGTPIGSVTKVSSGSGFTLVKLFNAKSGRNNQVYIISDPSTGAFLRVIAATASPFMCHDPMGPPCSTNYTDLGTGLPTGNCNSPINFSGALNGSVNNLGNTGAYQYYNCTY